jgi:hypothetical protein
MESLIRHFDEESSGESSEENRCGELEWKLEEAENKLERLQMKLEFIEMVVKAEEAIKRSVRSGNSQRLSIHKIRKLAMDKIRDVLDAEIITDRMIERNKKVFDELMVLLTQSTDKTD